MSSTHNLLEGNWRDWQNICPSIKYEPLAKILLYTVYIYISFLHAYLLILYSDTSQEIMWCLYIPEPAASFTTAKIPTPATRNGQSWISRITITHEPT